MKLIKKAKIKKQTCYDLHIKSHHNFYANDVCVHNTNAAIVIDENRKVTVQSRSRKITVMSDNAGFAAFVAGLPQKFFDAFTMKNIAIFGEFCGGNIQKGVALNGLPKMFVIFAIKDLDSDEWMNIDDYSFPTEMLNEVKVFVTNQFPNYTIEIDFNKPELAQAKLSEITEAVEAECPVGKYFGVSGIGEGVVWSHNQERDLTFKVKGTAHSASKVKTLAPVDIEKVNNVSEFVEMTVTPQRLEQGIQVMKEKGLPIERSSTGDFLRWVVTDILSEELDTLTGNGLCAKDVGGPISNAARPYWFRMTDEA